MDDEEQKWSLAIAELMVSDQTQQAPDLPLKSESNLRDEMSTGCCVWPTWSSSERWMPVHNWQSWLATSAGSPPDEVCYKDSSCRVPSLAGWRIHHCTPYQRSCWRRSSSGFAIRPGFSLCRVVLTWQDFWSFVRTQCMYMYYACVTSGAGHTRTRAVWDWHFLTAFMPCRAGQTFGATVLLLLLYYALWVHYTAHLHSRNFGRRTSNFVCLTLALTVQNQIQRAPRASIAIAETSCELSSYALYCACAAHLHSRKTHFRTSQCRAGPWPAQRLRSDFRATHCEYNYYMYYLVVRSAYRIHGTSYVWHSVQTQCRGPQAESETSPGQIWVYIFMSLCSLNCFYGSSMKFRTLSWCDWSPCQHRKEFQSNIALPFCQSGQTFVGEDGPWKNGLPLAIGLRREFK